MKKLLVISMVILALVSAGLVIAFRVSTPQNNTATVEAEIYRKEWTLDGGGIVYANDNNGNCYTIPVDNVNNYSLDEMLEIEIKIK